MKTDRPTRRETELCDRACLWALSALWALGALCALSAWPWR